MTSQINIVSGSISLDEKSVFWIGSVVLAGVADYEQFAINDMFVLDLLGEQYHLMVDGKSISQSFGQVQYTLSVVSVGARRFRLPDGTKITKDYFMSSSGVVVPALAEDICNQILADGFNAVISTSSVSVTSVDTVLWANANVIIDGQLTKQTITTATFTADVAYTTMPQPNAVPPVLAQPITPPDNYVIWSGIGVTNEYYYASPQPTDIVKQSFNIPTWDAGSGSITLVSTTYYSNGTSSTSTVLWCTPTYMEPPPTIQWNMVNWLIPDGRVSAVRSVALDVIKPIIAAGGGVLESLPNGQLVARPLFPVSILAYETTTPDQIYTEADDLFTLSENYERKSEENKIILRDEPMLGLGSGFLSAEVDTRPSYLAGYNKTDQFFAGDTVYILVVQGPWVVIDRIDLSDGILVDKGISYEEMEEFLTFTYENEKTVQKPIYSIVSFQWLGNPLLQPDNTVGSAIVQAPKDSIIIGKYDSSGNIVAANRGTAMAYMRYTTQCHVYGIKSPVAMNNPLTMQGLGQYPIQVRVVGTFTPPIPGTQGT